MRTICVGIWGSMCETFVRGLPLRVSVRINFRQQDRLIDPEKKEPPACLEVRAYPSPVRRAGFRDLSRRLTFSARKYLPRSIDLLLRE